MIKHLRQLKVGKAYPAYQTLRSERPDKGKPPLPVSQTLLKRQWLQHADFAVDTAVDVRVMQGCLVLTCQHNPAPLLTPLASFHLLSKGEQQLLHTLAEQLLSK